MRMYRASNRASYAALKIAEFTSKNRYEVVFSVLTPEVAFSVTMGIPYYVMELLPNDFLLKLLSYIST